MRLQTLDGFDVSGKIALVRVDANVPVADGQVTDDTRLRRIVPTVSELLKAGAKPVLLSHFGRPKDGPDPQFSLAQIVPALSKVLGCDVTHASDCIGDVASQAISEMTAGSVLLLENTRFHAGEKTNDPAFAAELARLGDVFVSDAFSASHRAHASVSGIAALMPSAAGRLMEEEITALERCLGTPKRPVLAVVGGAKVSTKLDLLNNLIEPMDKIVIGGGMANTFLAAQGIDVGISLCEHDLAETARDIMAKAKAANCELVLPQDVVVAKEFKVHAENQTVAANACPSDAMILDAGAESIKTIEGHLEQCKTVIWNGPLGAFEMEPFDTATNAAAKKAADLTKAGKIISVAGGGDTVAALNVAGAADDFTYISTAGGAFLEWMEGKTLPGVVPLLK